MTVIEVFTPTPKQATFHEDRGKVKFRGLVGKWGSGKSHALFAEVLEICRDAPDLVGLLAAPMPFSAYLLNRRGQLRNTTDISKLDRADQSITFTMGSKVLYVDASNEIDRIRGVEANFLAMDDAHKCSESAWHQLTHCIRNAADAQIIAATYPDEKTWAYSAFVSHNHPLTKIYHL